MKIIEARPKCYSQPMEIPCPACRGAAYVQTPGGIVPCSRCGGRGVLIKGYHY